MPHIGIGSIPRMDANHKPYNVESARRNVETHLTAGLPALWRMLTLPVKPAWAAQPRGRECRPGKRAKVSLAANRTKGVER